MLLGLIIHNFISPLILAGTDDQAPRGFFSRTWRYGSYCFMTGIAIIYYFGR